MAGLYIKKIPTVIPEKKNSHTTPEKVYKAKDYRRSKNIKIRTQDKPYREACSAGQAVLRD